MSVIQALLLVHNSSQSIIIQEVCSHAQSVVRERLGRHVDYWLRPIVDVKQIARIYKMKEPEEQQRLRPHNFRYTRLQPILVQRLLQHHLKKNFTTTTMKSNTLQKYERRSDEIFFDTIYFH